MNNRPVPISNHLGSAVILLVACAFLAGAAFQFYQNQKFERDGQHSQGTVTSRSVDPGNSKHGPFYKIGYRYIVQGGTHSGTATVSAADYGRLTVGGAVPLTVLPGEPDASRIDLPDEVQGEKAGVWGPAMIGLPLLAFGALIYSLPRK